MSLQSTVHSVAIHIKILSIILSVPMVTENTDCILVHIAMHAHGLKMVYAILHLKLSSVFDPHLTYIL